MPRLPAFAASCGTTGARSRTTRRRPLDHPDYKAAEEEFCVAMSCWSTRRPTSSSAARRRRARRSTARCGEERVERRREAPRLGRPRPAARDPVPTSSPPAGTTSARRSWPRPRREDSWRRARALRGSHMAFVEEPDRFREVSRTSGSRGVALTPRRVRWLATATVLTLYVIVITGSLVRLTDRPRLRCVAGLRGGGLLPRGRRSRVHRVREPRLRDLPDHLLDPDRLGCEAPASLDVLDGGRRCRADGRRRPARAGDDPLRPPPEIVMVHFLVALLALGGALVVLVEAIRAERGAAARVPARAADRSRRPRSCVPGPRPHRDAGHERGHAGRPGRDPRLWTSGCAVHPRPDRPCSAVSSSSSWATSWRGARSLRASSTRSCCSPCCSRK